MVHAPNICKIETWEYMRKIQIGDIVKACYPGKKIRFNFIVFVLEVLILV